MDAKRFVHNLSSASLDNRMLEILSLGPKFRCLSKKTKQLVMELLSNKDLNERNESYASFVRICFSVGSDLQSEGGHPERASKLCLLVQ